MELEVKRSRTYYLAHKDAWRKYGKSARAKRDPVKHAAQNLSWYRRNRERLKKEMSERRFDNPRRNDNNRKDTLKKYGLTPETYNERLESQNGVCAICLRPETQIDTRFNTVRKLSVDHNHKTEETRGLLCQRCNTAVGMLQEDAQRARMLAAYLEIWS